ncbi:hypothetical protein [Ferrovibrio sp.]|uniref:DUF6898 family protein n=1 Tax=Ferrovibrio sp. TaxID=1917215 RepID=UPI0025BF5FEE|nr:hypothetical protein [Ferrovibrio sp.]MBX3454001.1 hypothetical protein [Ferrovibrio sp.]
MSDDDLQAIIEFRRVGSVLKVIAVDPATGIEVSMVGDPRYSQQELGRLAARKLRYVLDKKAGKA